MSFRGVGSGYVGQNAITAVNGPRMALPTSMHPMSPDETEPNGSEIAVIAMAGRFPGAATLEQYWANVRDGVESVRFFTDEELLAAGEDPSALADPAYVRAWPQLEGIELFDAGFFGISPRDASVMDPQHRFFLEVAWEAMERAGYSGKSAPLATGIFAAAGMNHYMLHHLVPNKEVMRTVGEWLVRHTSNDMNFLATRAAYQMNLKGPALNIQTACSSSIVAIHLACQSLLNRETDLALAGASTMSLPQDRGYLFKQGEILTADGHCRPFDAHSKGTLFGSGTGVVVLKRLQDAIDDGDTIVSVIRGSAINNDGSQKVGYLAPSVDGQARAVSEALAISAVPVDSIGFIETHGTGTVVGDPIEVTALAQAYAPLTDQTHYIALGSVKANIGHLGEAAGMAGFIKTTLALQHAQLPPCINFTTPNPEIDFESSPFFVNTVLAPWPSTGVPRRAGVTALGAGGTNAHLILEEAPVQAPSGPAMRAAQVLTLSARSRSALETQAAQLAAFLETSPSVNLADVAFTLQAGRTAFPYRRSIAARSAASAAAVLREPQKGTVPATTQDDARVIYMFPGGGAQYAGMGRELYDTEPVYRAAFDDCLADMPDSVAGTLRRLVFPSAADTAQATTELEAPRLALPALFATEYATARLLANWGLTPSGMIGHSMGEYVAACIAGVLTRRDALTLVMERARLFETLPPGGMLSVELSEKELQPLLGAQLSIAAVNSPSLCVASGPVAAIEALQSELQRREVECTRIHINVAAHSIMLEPILAEFARVCSRVTFSPPTVPFISNLTGAWITAEQATDPQYWVRHLRQAVRFADGLAAVLADGRNVLVEIGPGRTLCSLARAQTPTLVALPSLRHPRESASDVEFLLGTLGRVWENGGAVQLDVLHGETRRRRIPLPTYPFEHQRFWIDAGVRDTESAESERALVRQADVRDWFAMPAWRRSAPVRSGDDATMPTWLLFADQAGIAQALVAQRKAGTTILVSQGPRFERRSERHYALRADSRDDYSALVESLQLNGQWPNQVVHLWGVESPKSGGFLRARSPEPGRNLERAESELYRSLLYLVQAMAEHESPMVLTTVASGLFACQPDDVLDPTKSLLLGPTQVTPREFPHISSRCIDVQLSRMTAVDCAARLLPELQREVEQTAIAVRPASRFVRVLDRVPLDAAPPGEALVRDRATVLITGGLGGIGLEVAAHLAQTAKARLVLIGRTPMPPREEWAAVARHGASELLRQQVTRLLAIEEAGGEVLTVGADVTDAEQMSAVVASAHQRFGPIHGVIHAAGVIDDGLMSLKATTGTSRVIDVKARGALVLDLVLRHEPLDFFMNFSSISAVLGLEGQVDYTAANAFLDAFAEQKRRVGGVRAISVGWNAWREVGMAAALAENSPHGAARTRGNPGPHPDLERLASETHDTQIYTTLFSRARQWLVAEHVVRGGDALIPGTGYLELARATLDAHPEARTAELRNVTFMRPFVVSRSEQHTLRLTLTRSPDSPLREFAFQSDRDDDPAVTGSVGYSDASAEPDDALATIQSRIPSTVTVGGFIDQPFMDFGPRWSNVMDIATGEGEALIHLRLPDEFHADLATYKLHPALMDMATGGAQRLIPGFSQATDFYVPFAYERVRLFAGLTPELYSHVRYRAGGRGDTARFDVQLFAPDGTVLGQLHGFTMKRLAAGAALTGSHRSDDGQSRAPAPASTTQLGALLQLGISSVEGVDAFDRILASGLDGHIVASSLDLSRWSASLARQQARAAQATDGESDGGASFERPNLGTSYVGPRNALERELADVWKQLLGVKEIGIHDDFFELGGQSLVAVRLFNRIRKHYKVDLPLSTLFEAPTIAQCAAVIADEAGIDLSTDSEVSPVATTAQSAGDAAANDAAPTSIDASPSRPAADKGSRWRTLVVMQGKGALPPFACVAGMGGTLNNLRQLAVLMGEGRPFYGLQPPGADDMDRLLYSVEELATHYVTELRKVQPRGPYCLGGYSGGGIAAFEMARQLTADGEEVSFLGFIDSFSPALPQRSLTSRAMIHVNRVREMGPGYLWTTAMRRIAMERSNMRLRLSRPLGRILPDRFRYEAVQESFVVAEARYRPTAQDQRATLFRAREESAISLWTAVDVDEMHGWGRYLTQGVDVQFCPGNHATMCEEPNVRVLAAKLRSALDAASSIPLAVEAEALTAAV